MNLSSVVHFEDLAQATPPQDTVFAIGVFDGVHLGHQYLLRQTVQRARDLGCLSGAITFHPHPRQVLAPNGGPCYLIRLEDRLRLIREQGIEIVITIAFTRELSRVSAADFVGALKRHLRLRELQVGANFALGRGREGTPDRLVQLGQEMDFGVQVVQSLVVDGLQVSSTAVRQALQEGDVELVARLTGRPVTLSGEVVRGVARAQTLGFPTANLRLDPALIAPPWGVYAVRVHLGGKLCPGVASLGVRPTFDSGEPLLEVHLLDFRGDLYGRSLAVDLVRRLRPEVRFASVADLVAQVQQDIRQAREVLGVLTSCVEC